MTPKEPQPDIVPTARYARVLSIAGSDSGGGAGIQADLKTIAALGCYGMTAITAITAQNTLGVRAIHALPPELLAQQIDAVVEDIGVDAVKIGMLHDEGVVQVVANAIRRHRFAQVVLDPVMVASSGDKLITASTVDRLVDTLFPLATLITPNLDETAWLLRLNAIDADALEGAANRLHDLGAHAVLLKGGHLCGPQLTDLLRLPDGRLLRWEATRIPTRNTHGTGCSLSSAIACHLALGAPLAEAVALGRDYVRQALRAGADMQLGHGHGPLDHGHAPRATRRLPL
ncbi:MAG: bifunctional hydroxymethylpyrimidine kinase/phosphomethylpyrimidine kinase [Thiomonas sp.]|uniref:bifunctional hydroxymethylpyrimidine kinase/phosphomethylpyrimidine kinase n=1 Tax=Thiomonas sp. TaxID=2047785 RepID=UPI002A35DF07|nr:bifunctional hydroxymethylpyrimidine kinase/phosphomethylpyrimidine kinase [Thiomonas sp.]MDY0329663.1 bifunctional hydroxymethylpyrimidine kinase/phosphomethylpyrimidine kinase [Thiomonas sp.]